MEKLNAKDRAALCQALGAAIEQESKALSKLAEEAGQNSEAMRARGQLLTRYHTLRAALSNSPEPTRDRPSRKPHPGGR